MESNTFQKSVSFISKTPIGEGGTISWEDKVISKTATFKELSRTDVDQHKLHMKLINVFRKSKLTADQNDDGDGRVDFDYDAVYDLTVAYIKKMLILDDSFNATNKAELLTDSGAIFSLGMDLMGDKIAPFFPTLLKT